MFKYFFTFDKLIAGLSEGTHIDGYSRKLVRTLTLLLNANEKIYSPIQPV